MTKSRTLNGLFWSFSDNFLQQLINFIVGIILARLLLPEEFGILGIITVFISISNVFVDGGLSDALINKKDVSQEDYSTVFWVNVAIGIFCFILFYFTAPLIALFFQLETLIYPIRITALSLIFFSLSSIQRTIYTKRLDFKTITKVSLISVLVSGVVAIYMAYTGFGILSLVYRIVIGQILTVILFYLFSSWRPLLIFNVDSFKGMVSYGINLFFSKLLNTTYNNFYYFIIGKWFSPAILGYYTRADTFKNITSINVINTITRVSFASLSAMEKEKQLIGFKEFLLGTFFIISFLMAILFCCADPIILILLGDKWYPSIEYLKIISFSGLFLPIYFMNLNFLAVIKKTKYYIISELVTKITIIPITILGVILGIKVLLWMIVFHSFFSYLFICYQIERASGYKVISQIKMLSKMFFTYIFAILIVYLCQHFYDFNIYVNLFITLGIIVLIFFIGYLVSKKEFSYLISILKNNLKK
jgi:O-antigen/teichoic acid export membrane protein